MAKLMICSYSRPPLEHDDPAARPGDHVHRPIDPGIIQPREVVELVVAEMIEAGIRLPADAGVSRELLVAVTVEKGPVKGVRPPSP